MSDAKSRQEPKPARTSAVITGPGQDGLSGIAAGNLIGTVLDFTLFNLGLITVLTPVAVPPTARTLDWPVLAGVSLLVAVLLARGRVTRAHGLLLLAIEAGYVAAHVWVR